MFGTRVEVPLHFCSGRPLPGLVLLGRRGVCGAVVEVGVSWRTFFPWLNEVPFGKHSLSQTKGSLREQSAVG